ncbi:class IV adenylate cyclase [Porticoccus sp.]|nr:MAG: CYTH domain-containing protein [Gammaproteobacteria bacterium]
MASIKEIEVKVLEVDRASLEQKILDLGGHKEFESEFFAILFDDADGSIQAAGNLLRLRKEQDGVKLTYKQTVSTGLAKIMDEHETAVDDFEVMRQILASLGYREGLSLRKNRAQFSLDGQHLVFDKYFDELEHIPEFLEIEAQSEEALLALIKRLGIEREQTRPWNTRDLMQHYQKK